MFFIAELLADGGRMTSASHHCFYFQPWRVSAVTKQIPKTIGWLPLSIAVTHSRSRSLSPTLGNQAPFTALKVHSGYYTFKDFEIRYKQAWIEKSNRFRIEVEIVPSPKWKLKRPSH